MSGLEFLASVPVFGLMLPLKEMLDSS